jgi:hypothetical protein
MKAQLSGAGVQSIRHPLNEKGAPQSNGWNPQPSWCTVCWNPLDENHNQVGAPWVPMDETYWTNSTTKWVHQGFQWMKPIGWNPQLSGCAPPLGNLLDEDQNWVGAPGFPIDETCWMKSTPEWVHTILRKLVGWRPQLSGCTWFCDGWDLLDEIHNWVGCAPSIGNLFGWRTMNPLNGCTMVFQWMRPIGWKPKLSYQDSKPQNWQHDSAIFQRMKDNKNSARLVLLLY